MLDYIFGIAITDVIRIKRTSEITYNLYVAKTLAIATCSLFYRFGFQQFPIGSGSGT